MLPIRVAFPRPSLAYFFLPSTERMPDSVLIASFVESLSVYDATVVKEAFKEVKVVFYTSCRSFIAYSILFKG